MLLRFLLVGLANTAVGLICIWGAMYFLRLDAAAANLAGYVVGLSLSFALNRSWTFRHRGAVLASFLRWLAIALPAYLANLGIVLGAHRLGGLDAYLAQPLGIAAYTILTFLGARYVVFARSARSGGGG